MLYIQVISLSVFLWGMIIKLNTSIFTNGRLVNDRQQIYEQYKNESFYYDLLGLWAILYNMIKPEPTLLNYILVSPIFAKSVALKKIIDVLYEKMNLTGNWIHLWSLA